MLMASDLQNFLFQKLLQFHMHLNIVSNSSMVQTIRQSNLICECSEFPKKIPKLIMIN
jgi:hypothetical protein